MLARSLAVVLIVAVVANGCGPSGPSYTAALAALKEEQAKLVELQAESERLKQQYLAATESTLADIPSSNPNTILDAAAGIDENAKQFEPILQKAEDAIAAQLLRVAAARETVNAAAKREGLPLLP